ncbi:MAG: hypothetical protein AAGI03_13685 [Pseudomonadota bacterium]
MAMAHGTGLLLVPLFLRLCGLEGLDVPWALRLVLAGNVGLACAVLGDAPA